MFVDLIEIVSPKTQTIGQQAGKLAGIRVSLGIPGKDKAMTPFASTSSRALTRGGGVLGAAGNLLNVIGIYSHCTACEKAGGVMGFHPAQEIYRNSPDAAGFIDDYFYCYSNKGPEF
jgi:hypothetical protein